MTALHIAAREGHSEVVRSLMLAGIDMDECTSVFIYSCFRITSEEPVLILICIFSALT